MAQKIEQGLRIVWKNIPEDLQELILRKQAEFKIECKCQVNKVQTIYKLLRMAVK